MHHQFPISYARRLRRPTRAVLLGAAACAALAGGAAAEPGAGQGAAAPAGQDAAASVEEIVVTARHRSENLQSVPATISAVSAEFLDKTNTTSITQLVSYLPSVQFSFFNPRNSSLNIRGLGNASGVASDGMEPGVGFYVDQVYYNRPAMATFDLVDIQQVEVLEGPQGTLFGKNTTAGVINITTNAPSFTPEAKAEATGGAYGYYVLKGSVSGPLVEDKLAARLSLSTARRDGLTVNDFNGEKSSGYRTFTVRGQLLYTPTSDLRLRFIADYNRYNANCCASVLASIVTPPNGKNYRAITAPFGYTPVVDPFERHINVDSPVYALQETGGASLEAQWALPHAVISSITAWRFWNWWPGNDVDATPLPVLVKANQNNYENQVSQEFRIASAGESLLDYVAGLYFFREQVQAQSMQRYGSAGSAFLLGPAVPAAVLDGYGLNTDTSYNTWSYAAYGQATWHFARRWSLTGGLRFTHDRKTARFDQTVGGGATLAGPLATLASLRTAIASPASLKASLKADKLSGQANLSYRPTQDILLYATVARGSRSPGINLVQLPPQASPIISAETITSFELGAKTRLLDNRLTANLTLFREQDKNYQGTAQIVGTTRSYLTNIPKVVSQGVELNLSAQPDDHVTLYANGVYDDAHYVSFPNSPCGLENMLTPTCDLSGRPVAGVPLWSVSFGGEYHTPLTVGARQIEAYAGVDNSYRSSFYSSGTDSIYTRIDGLNLLNARIGVRATDGRWDLYAWGKNITDQHYFNSTSPGLGNTGAINASLGDPLTWGVTARARY
jgi:iron complex outermembrane receptor protein